MEPIDSAAWTDDDRTLWARIAAHDFEPAGASLTFAGRLARDHGWSLAAARAAIDEYRRFCFLAVRAGAEVTPSEEVDEVWHLHLAYTRDYWLVWCREVLRRDLHHGPTLGGPAEGRRFAEQYAGTLAAYEAWFGPPPADLWPGTAERFGRPRFRIVDRDASLVVPIPRAISHGMGRVLALAGLLLPLSARPASASGPLGVLDWTAGPFLTLYVLLAAASLVAARALALVLTGTPRGGTSRGRLMPAEVALLAGGHARAADAFVLQALASGEASLDGTLVVTPDARRSRGELARDLSDRVEAVRARLVADGLALSHERHALVGLACVAATAPVLLLGLAKAGVGHGRDKPVGILLAMVLVTLIIAVVMAAVRRPTSAAGRRLLAAYREEHARAIRAPRPDEVVAAFAVAGSGALVGTALEPYRALIEPPGGAAGDSSSGGDGGSGCGGGGCGGCGGGN